MNSKYIRWFVLIIENKINKFSSKYNFKFKVYGALYIQISNW